MAGEYTVKVLSPEDFNKLPFKRIQEDPDSVFGAAEVATKTAYVKDTGFNDFTKANIGHELDELMASTSPHEEDGIRYKSLGDAFGSIGGGIKNIGSAVTSGIGSLGRGIKNVFTPGPAAASGPASPDIFSAPPIGGSDQGGAALNRIGSFSGFGTGGGASSPSPSNLIAGGIPNFDTGSGGGLLNSVLKGFGNLFSQQGGGGGGGGGTTPNTPDGGGGGGPTDIFGQLKGAAPGAAVALLGNLFANKVDAPDFGGIKSDLASKMGEGGSPAFDLGFGEAKRQLSGETGQIPQAELAAIDLRRDEEIAALEDRFRSAQGGGGMSESDTSRFGTLRADIVDKFEQDKQRLEFAYKQQQEANRIQVMSEVLRLDSAQFEQYTQLANLDISELMIKTGIDAQTATQFKELFGNVGGQMISSQFPTRT